METRKHASERAEHHGHRWHLFLQLGLVILAVALFLVGYEFHVNELSVVAGGTMVLVIIIYVWSLLFEGYYAFYCKEWLEADRSQNNLDEAQRHLRDTRKELEDIRQSPSWTKADAENENKRRELWRWIETGELLQHEIHHATTNCVTPSHDTDFLPAELLGRVAAWSRDADKYVQSNFAYFLERFRSEDGIPPKQPNLSGRGWHHHEVYRRVERFTELYINKGGRL